MANNPCPNKVDACDCDAQRNPLTNFSSEVVDEITYRAVSWVTPVVRINQDPDNPNGPGRPPSLCVDPRSPFYAQLCADRNSYIYSNLQFRNGTQGAVFSNSPQACTVNCPDGSIFTFQLGAGEVVGPDPYSVDRQAAAIACQQAIQRRLCLSTITEAACEGVFYADSVAASGPVTIMEIVSGSLPPGLSFGRTSASSYGLAGTPTTAGNYTFEVHATGLAGGFMQKVYTIKVLGITNTSPLTDATENSPYVQIFSGAGATAPYTFAVISGALPAGLTLDPNGLLSGTPTESGDFTFTIEVTDSTP